MEPFTPAKSWTWFASILPAPTEDWSAPSAEWKIIKLTKYSPSKPSWNKYAPCSHKPTTTINLIIWATTYDHSKIQKKVLSHSWKQKSPTLPTLSNRCKKKSNKTTQQSEETSSFRYFNQFISVKHNNQTANSPDIAERRKWQQGLRIYQRPVQEIHRIVEVWRQQIESQR